MNRQTVFGVLLLVVLWPGTFAAAASPAPQTDPLGPSGETYFPLCVGNSWSYLGDDASTKKFTIVGTQEIKGNTYYLFDDCYTPCGFPGWDSLEDLDLLFRHDPESGNVFQYCPALGKDVVRYDFSGKPWGAEGNQLVQSGVSRAVLAGQFDDCLVFEYGMVVDCGVFYETLAPGVGTIQFYSSWEGDYQLQSCTIVPEPSTCVLLPAGAVCLLPYVWRRRRRPA